MKERLTKVWEWCKAAVRTVRKWIRNTVIFIKVVFRQLKDVPEEYRKEVYHLYVVSEASKSLKKTKDTGSDNNTKNTSANTKTVFPDFQTAAGKEVPKEKSEATLKRVEVILTK